MESAEFENWVRNALSHYGDSAQLQNSPLLEYLAPAALPVEDRVGALRGELRRALETLRPPSTVSYNHPDWLPYRVVWSRCIQRRSQIQVCDTLNLSRATFYRYQAEAVKAVARVLWDYCHSARAAGTEAGVEPISALSSTPGGRPDEGSGRQAIDLHALLDDVGQIMHSLLRRQGTVLEFHIAADAPTVYGEPEVLRQIVINALAGAMSVGTGPVLSLRVSAADDETLFEIDGLRPRSPLNRTSERPELSLCRRLLASYGGRLEDSLDASAPVMRFSLPAWRPPMVLIVEDDKGTIDYYQRALLRAGLAVRSAQSAAEMRAAMAQDQPDLILLDVLMPDEDGWVVLQGLKTLPDTADIPVVVCSVLAQPSLALSMGACHVLLKPISEAALLQAIREALEQADSVDAPPR